MKLAEKHMEETLEEEEEEEEEKEEKEEEEESNMASTSEKTGTLFAKLNNENYMQWSFKMKMLLIRDGLWKVIENEKPALDLTWDVLDQKAFATIVLCVGDDQVVHVKRAKTAKESWDVLKAYHQKSSLTSQVALLKKLYKAELKTGGDMKAHMRQMFEWFDELNEIGCGEEEHKAILILLASLSDEYRTIVTALEAREIKSLKLSDVRTKLMEEHDRMIAGSSSKTEEALKIQAAYKNYRFDGDCHFCKRKGHLQRDCDEFKEWLEKKKKRSALEEESSYDDKHQAKTAMMEKEMVW